MASRSHLSLHKDAPVRREQLAIEVVRAIDQRADGTRLLAQIHALTDNPWYDEPFFRMLHSRCSPKEFAELAALGNPPTIPDLTRDEIVELIRLASNQAIPRLLSAFS
jgi:hypothetical protein